MTQPPFDASQIAIGSKIKAYGTEYVVDDITDRDGWRTVHATAPADSRNTSEIVRHYVRAEPDAQRVTVTINKVPFGEWSKP